MRDRKRTRKGKRRGWVKQEQVERGEIERPEEDAGGMGKTKEEGEGEGEGDGSGRGWKRLIEERWRK